MEVQFYCMSLQGTESKDWIKESSNYRRSNYGDPTVVSLITIVLNIDEWRVMGSANTPPKRENERVKNKEN